MERGFYGNQDLLPFLHRVPVQLIRLIASFARPMAAISSIHAVAFLLYSPWPHGNPMNAVLANGYTEACRRIGAQMRKPKAILAISAQCVLVMPGARHWDILPAPSGGRSQRQLGPDAYAVWTAGCRVALCQEDKNPEPPYFPRGVSVRAYLTLEAEAVARALCIPEMRWYSVFDGNRVLSQFSAAAADNNPEYLVQTAEMDLFGRQPYQLLLFEMAGFRHGAAKCRSLVLKASSGSVLTGVVAALGTRAVLEGRIPAGVHYLAEAVPPEQLCEALKKGPEALLVWTEQDEALSSS